ncbi:MAG: hypothetical protein GY953_19700 [bacterium]|nr:hypothetical protein [bacterium]
MLRRSFTAVLEKNTTFTESFHTEPYEVAWAGEARLFVRVLEMSGTDASLQLHPQVSPDGLFWCNEGSDSLVIYGPGLYSMPLANFGHWLRFHGILSGATPSAKVFIYVALKE